MYKLKTETLNDGVLYYGSVKSQTNLKREKIGEDFIEKGHLYFEKMSVRDSDLIIASQLGYKIDLKLKVFKRDNITSLDKVKVATVLYDIKNLDSDNKFMYIYLQLVKAGV